MAYSNSRADSVPSAVNGLLVRKSGDSQWIIPTDLGKSVVSPAPTATGTELDVTMILNYCVGLQITSSDHLPSGTSASGVQSRASASERRGASG